MPTANWRVDRSGEPYYLIESPELRETYGLLIGRIAHSHWWPVDQLIKEFAEPMGVPGGYPQQWEVDALKVAALLRVADASHLDERRAPSFLWALRKPTGISESHWRFQNYLLQPRRESDRLVYTAKRPFRLEEATAWWFCYDALQMVDSELRQVDALLADLGGKRPRFAVRGVAKVESPERLAQLVRTDSWIPVDTRVRVTDVAGLARNIGGEQLYGRNNTVPLRELIQNAADAIRARRVVEDLPEDWGDVCIRHGEDEEGQWIEVEDNGLGMSLNVLKGPLLDFGSSYWNSELVINELPGLLAKGFQPTGQYGIGFFSVFMWGERVRVITRRSSDAHESTRVLEFGSGLSSRPILRKAIEREYRLSGGTTVRVWPKEPLVESTGKLSRLLRGIRRPKTLEELCAWMCPSIDVNIYIEREQDGRKKVITASDWKSLDQQVLARRLALDYPIDDLTPDSQRRWKTLIGNWRVLQSQSGEVIGRASVYHSAASSIDSFEVRRLIKGVITVGGIRASTQQNISGLLVGRSTRATRDIAIPIVEQGELRRWASDQAGLVINLYTESEHLKECAKIIRGYGGDTGKLPVAFGVHGWFSIPDIIDWKSAPSRVLLVNSYELKTLLGHGNVVINDDVCAVDGSSKKPDWLRDPRQATREPQLIVPRGNGEQRQLSYFSLKVAVIEALAKLWSVSLEDVLQASDFSLAEHKVAKRGRRAVKLAADVIVKP